MYPYLLRGKKIERANEVWATDITYIPMARGRVYLAAVVDWASRRVLAHRVSISMDVAFCLDALDEAFARHGKPEIFNTDQGSQFTSLAFTDALKSREVAIADPIPRLEKTPQMSSTSRRCRRFNRQLERTGSTYRLAICVQTNGATSLSSPRVHTHASFGRLMRCSCCCFGFICVRAASCASKKQTTGRLF